MWMQMVMCSKTLTRSVASGPREPIDPEKLGVNGPVSVTKVSTDVHVSHVARDGTWTVYGRTWLNWLVSFLTRDTKGA